MMTMTMLSNENYFGSGMYIESMLSSLFHEAIDRLIPFKRYATLQSHLTQLSLKRQSIRQRLDQYTSLQQLLAPYEHLEDYLLPPSLSAHHSDSEPDGDSATMARELERMRELMGRVERGLKNWQGNDRDNTTHDGKNHDGEEWQVDSKLKAILDMGKPR